MIQIRSCVAGDFDEVILLLRQLWADKSVDPLTLRPIFDRALVSSSKTYLVATDENRVIGFGSLNLKDDLWPDGRVAYLDQLVVDTEYRKKGVGEQLLERLVSTAQQKNCCCIELTSAFYRNESHQFYEKRGFARRAFIFTKEL